MTDRPKMVVVSDEVHEVMDPIKVRPLISEWSRESAAKLKKAFFSIETSSGQCRD